MEDIYLNGFVGRREWCSDKINLKSYFDKYSEIVSAIPKKKISEIDILQHFVPQSNQLTENELNELMEITRPEHLTNLLVNDFHKEIKPEPGGKAVNGPSTSKSTQDLEDFNILRNPFLCKSNKNRIVDKKPSRREVRLDAAEKCGQRNLKPKQQYVVSFRIHAPFHHQRGVRIVRPGRCSQEIRALGHQNLTELRDKIICESDFQDTRGDVSLQPDAPVVQRARDKYHSSMFYIDNSFYIDRRYHKNLDYSECIRKWALGRGIGVGMAESMEYTLIQDLEFRLGYPYVYMHQGCCEHLVIISDARLLSAKDSLYKQDYPMMVKLTHKNMVHCMICSQQPAKWIVRESDRLAHDPSFMCKSCFKALHYHNGKKISHFKAYHYWQHSAIL